MSDTSNGFVMRQRSALNGFAYDFVGADGGRLGGFEFAFFAQARNARLRVHDKDAASTGKGAIRLQWAGQAYLVHHLYTRRGFTNDLRYSLEREDGSVLAEAEVLVNTPAQRLPVVRLLTPVKAELGVSAGFWRKRFELRAEGRPLGSLEEPAALSLRRTLRVDLPALPGEVAAFVAVVALCVRY